MPDDSNSNTAFLHVKPFSTGTWIVTFIVLTLLFVVHYGMSREINNSTWFAMSCLTMQGIHININTS